MNKTEIIPAFGELAQIETALPVMDSLEQDLQPLEELARSLQVDSAESMAAAGTIIRDVKHIREQAKATLKPYDLAVIRVKIFLRERLNKVLNRAELIHGTCTAKMAEYDKRERAAAAKEQAALNRKNARSGAPEVTVQPNVPTMAGATRRVNHMAECTNEEKFMLEFAKRFAKGDDSLRRYVSINAAALNEAARQYKNPEQMMKEVPFVKAWSETTFGGRA